MAMGTAAAPDEGSADSAPAGDQAQGSGDQSGGGGVSQLIIGIDAGMSKLMALVAQAKGVPPGVAEKLQAAQQAYQSAVDTLTGGSGGGDQGASQPATGPASMEQGGSSKAVPAY